LPTGTIRSPSKGTRSHSTSWCGAAANRDRGEPISSNRARERPAARKCQPEQLITLVKHFASALGPRDIRVNAVAPGVVETDMSNFTKTDTGRDYTLGMQALKRLAQPDDIGGVVAFLASDDARWITGDTVRADGGSKL
jgi:hypothetical protein